MAFLHSLFLQFAKNGSRMMMKLLTPEGFDQLTPEQILANTNG
jgi:hypothetical protein